MKLITAAAAIAISAIAIHSAGYRLNLTPSYTQGIWQLTDSPMKTGTMVMPCPPNTELFQQARENNYIGYGTCPGNLQPMLKRIAATAGDHIEVTTTIAINGNRQPNSQIHLYDHSGNPMPQQATPGIIADGQIFVLSDYNHRSFDSRYFGAIPAAQVVSAIQPIFTW